MHLSEQLLEELIKAKIITDKFCDKKAKLIIREYFIRIHREAVLATVIATNKQKFISPNFED